MNSEVKESEENRKRKRMRTKGQDRVRWREVEKSRESLSVVGSVSENQRERCTRRHPASR